MIPAPKHDNDMVVHEMGNMRPHPGDHTPHSRAHEKHESKLKERKEHDAEEIADNE